MMDYNPNPTRRYRTALTLAGLDPSGGAGLLADVKTFSALGVYGMAVATALTVQNTQGVVRVEPVEPEILEQQIRTVVADIRPDAVKIGMVNDIPTIEVLARTLRELRPRHLVIDPIILSSSGQSLMRAEALQTFIRELLPLATLITPNLPEMEALTEAGCDLSLLLQQGIAVLVKGGHAEGDTKRDLLYFVRDGQPAQREYSAPAVSTRNTHGTGCTLSAAIAAHLALGHTLENAVASAKQYLTRALRTGADVQIGHGHGALNHLFAPTPLIKHPDLMNGIQFITHTTEQYSCLDGARMALAGGCRWIQLRMKEAPAHELERTAREMLTLCRAHRATFIIDDHVELALRIDADGVHLGRHDMPVDEARAILGSAFIIGGTANTIDDVERLARQGADYIGCGPFRFTTTKQNLSPILGTEGYRSILRDMRERGIHLPVVAIGGIGIDDLDEVMATGVSGIAISGSVLRAPDPTAAMRALVAQMEAQGK